MQVLVLAPFAPGYIPSQRYRIEQWARHLERDGIHFRISPFIDDAPTRIIHSRGHFLLKASAMLRGVARTLPRAAQVRRYDVVFVPREAALVGPPILERVASWSRPVIFDFDDAIWMPQHGSANPRWRWLRYPSKTSTICRIAAHVTAGNDFLAEWARRSNERVTVIPSTIDTGEYSFRKEHRRTDIPTIGWSGSHSTVGFLREIIPGLVETASRRRFRLLVVGAHIDPVDGLNIECRPWSADREVRDIAEMDVGLMPLPDTPWTRGKCAMKALLYLSLGIPAVASPVGANVDVVRDSETGFLASTPEDWADALTRLLDDEALRGRLGAAGRALVLERYASPLQAARLRSIFESVV